MIPIYRMKVIQIEITNACNLGCSNCTRFVGHHKKPFFMDLETVAKAIESLEGYPGQIGIMGGEPTIHPEFKEICEIVQKKIPDRRKRELWTNGCKWKEYEEIIYETFDKDLITYNSHEDKEVGEHQPLLIAATDILDDRELMWRLIGNCWVQWRWAASITPKGGFFCEVAAAQDMLFNGPGGYKLEKGWWNKNPNEFVDQVKRYCVNCSAAIPMKGVSAHIKYDIISPSNAKKLEKVGSPKYFKKNCKTCTFKMTEAEIEENVKRGWTPWSHRPYKQSGPDTRWV
ncbi:MAG: radical SAM protein [Victivallaceae bacterium]|nr:radical SAM protein [Victivallaceae bacterium]